MFSISSYHQNILTEICFLVMQQFLLSSASLSQEDDTIKMCSYHLTTVFTSSKFHQKFLLSIKMQLYSYNPPQILQSHEEMFKVQHGFFHLSSDKQRFKGESNYLLCILKKSGFPSLRLQIIVQQGNILPTARPKN